MQAREGSGTRFPNENRFTNALGCGVVGSDSEDHEQAFRDIVHYQAERLPAIAAGTAPLSGAALAAEVDATVRALQVFFNKWTVEVMFILRTHGVLRFNALKTHLAGISGRTLSTRLKELESQGLVNRLLHDEMPVRVEYSLTDEGRMVADLTLPAVTYLRLHGIGAKAPADVDRWTE